MPGTSLLEKERNRYYLVLVSTRQVIAKGEGLYIRYKEALTRLTDHKFIRKVILPDKNIIFPLLR